MKHRTQAEIDHLRLAFNSNSEPGLIENIVRRELKKSKEELDEKTLTTFFADRGYANTAKLVEEIVSMGIEMIGSSSIDFLGVAQGPFSLENAMSLQEIKIGSRRDGVTPLQWLTAFSKGFDELSKQQQVAFDEVCSPFLSSNFRHVTGIDSHKF